MVDAQRSDTEVHIFQDMSTTRSMQEDNMGGTHNNITGGMPGDGWRAQAKGASALSLNTKHHE